MGRPNKQAHSQVRIIAGIWRGRKLDFPLIDGLRPTPDRVRETVFNWLQPYLNGAQCLDLFAGSGALGVEAASRGAAAVDLVENHSVAAQMLQEQLQRFQAMQCRVHRQSAQQFVQQAQQSYNLVFIDPPYQADLWLSITRLLEQSACLAPQALIYLECPRRHDLFELPENWQLLKDKQAGDVRYCLFQRQ